MGEGGPGETRIEMALKCLSCRGRLRLVKFVGRPGLRRVGLAAEEGQGQGHKARQRCLHRSSGGNTPGRRSTGEWKDNVRHQV